MGPKKGKNGAQTNKKFGIKIDNGMGLGGIPGMKRAGEASGGGKVYGQGSEDAGLRKELIQSKASKVIFSK